MLQGVGPNGSLKTIREKNAVVPRVVVETERNGRRKNEKKSPFTKKKKNRRPDEGTKEKLRS